MYTENSESLYGSPEYMAWANMKQRCCNPKCDKYHRYGGRGITICDRWINSFSNFYEDMGQRPFPEAQIDRRNNDGDYEPDNCRWVTRRTNTNNRTAPKLTMSIAEEIRALYGTKRYSYQYFAEKHKISRQMVGQIINNKCWILENKTNEFIKNNKSKDLKQKNKISEEEINENHIRNAFESQTISNSRCNYKDFKVGYIFSSSEKGIFIEKIKSIFGNDWENEDSGNHYDMLRDIKELLNF